MSEKLSPIENMKALVVEDMIFAAKDVIADLLNFWLKKENIVHYKNTTSLNKLLEESFPEQGEQHFPYDVVFMDQKLEKDNTTDESVRMIKQKAPHIRIISISGDPDQSEEFDLTHISKPFRPNAIQALMKNFTNNQKQADPDSQNPN